MILALDIGNSRLKWTRVERDGQRRHGAIAWRDGGIAAAFDAIDGGTAPQRIVGACVAGAECTAAVGARAHARWSLPIEWLAVSAAAHGVRNGYRDPGELGVDRWLGVIAAWQQARGAACVIDCGTATTVNVIGADGEFRGGLIAPGVNLMQRALASHTAQLFSPGAIAAEWPARSTADAIRVGTLNAACGGIERALARLRAEAGVEPRCFITGGEAPLLASQLAVPCEHVPDLVLRGVLIAAGVDP
jgi:type III pantothenate kinase